MPCSIKKYSRIFHSILVKKQFDDLLFLIKRDRTEFAGAYYEFIHIAGLQSLIDFYFHPVLGLFSGEVINRSIYNTNKYEHNKPCKDLMFLYPIKKSFFS